ncbi:MAG: NAD(P)H-dependent oxidoreductase [Candidatus Gracilibacteria bacterium]|nr:NAD(P)H-dependent oxidoreductase [Candidatus Gracilibacteria bacterium]
MSFLSNLNWRYATKKFDVTKKISDADLEKILEAIRLAPSSYGLQPYHFYIVTNQEVKDKIQAVAWNQSQVGTASHLIIFAARTDLMQNKEEYFTLMSGGNPEVRAKLKGFEDMMNGFIEGKSEPADILAWTSKQAYIAQGFALAAAAELQIDSCPMEGFDSSAVGGILGLPESQKAIAMIPFGYRDASETPRPKVRFAKEQIFTEVN